MSNFRENCPILTDIIYLSNRSIQYPINIITNTRKRILDSRKIFIENNVSIIKSSLQMDKIDKKNIHVRKNQSDSQNLSYTIKVQINN